jgi:diguanylate cyclase (GGDEF)-like protein
MLAHMDAVQTAIAVQAVGTGLVSFFLWQLGRAIRVRFVTSWALATFTFAISLGFLLLTVSSDDFSWSARTAFGAFVAGTYLMIFLLRSGLRELSSGEPYRLAHLAIFAPLPLLGLIAPWLVSGMSDLVPIHFAVLGILFATTLAEMRSSATVHPTTARSSIGRPIVRGSLVFLSVLMFWHSYSAFAYDAGINWKQRSFSLIVVVDSLAELLIVFGIVILACERVRDQLDDNNRELMEAKAELETVARTDVLTGLLNRRAFEDLCGGAPSDHAYGCVAAIDLNDLKLLNDTHLHVAGDAALRHVARALQNHFRVTDPIFRFGGDEFAVVMPGGTVEELARRLDAIDGELVTVRLPGIPGPYTLRIAWGVAGYSAASDIESAHRRADEAMYVQKGRRKGNPPATRETAAIVAGG